MIDDLPEDTRYLNDYIKIPLPIVPLLGTAYLEMGRFITPCGTLEDEIHIQAFPPTTRLLVNVEKPRIPLLQRFGFIEMTTFLHTRYNYKDVGLNEKPFSGTPFTSTSFQKQGILVPLSGTPFTETSVQILIFIECFTTTFLRAHSWLNWVDEDDDEDEVGLKEKPEDTRYIKKITSK